MKNTAFKIFSLLLCLLLILPMMFSCGDDAYEFDDDDDDRVVTKKDKTDSAGTNKMTCDTLDDIIGGIFDDTDKVTGASTDTSAETGIVTMPSDESDFINAPDITYDGQNFYILSAGQVAYQDFGFSANDPEPLSRAQYLRQALVEAECDISIVYEEAESKDTSKQGPGYRKIENAVLAQNLDYHLSLIGGYDVSNLARGAYLYDLHCLKYNNFTNSYWDKNANDDLSMNDRLFFTNGSLTTAPTESTYVIFYNKAIAAQMLGGDDIYEIVLDGKWTVDKLAEYARCVSEDINGDDYMDGNDKYGLYVWDDSILGMLGAAGSKIATIAPDGTISLTLSNENTLNMFNKYMDIACDTSHALQYQRSGLKPSEGVVSAFTFDKALFWATSNINTRQLVSLESDFGILPYPKLSEHQERYYSTIAPYNSQFICVAAFTDNQEDFISHITELLAFYGERTVWPETYNFARDEGTYEMLDIIYSNYNYDVGLYYRIGNYSSSIMNLLRQRDNGFMPMYYANSSAAKATINELNDTFRVVLDAWQ